MLTVFGILACSSDLHYDSSSLSLEFKLPENPYDDVRINLQQRVQFDRDLIPLTKLELQEAWLSADGLKHVDVIIKDENGNENITTLPFDFDLNLVKSIRINIIDKANDKAIFWLTLPKKLQDTHDALLTAYPVGELRQYTDKFQRLELEFVLTLDPYQVMRYRRDVCANKDVCKAKLHFSMNFRMED